MHLVITDSGLGGLLICGALARSWAETGAAARITYLNAWPEQGRGYNDLPDMAGRARVFERALLTMARLNPDEILIACNTLSIVYDLTAFRKNPPVSVRGIIDAGVDLFFGALSGHPGSSILLLGTRTTIDSGVHRERLVQRGVEAERIAAVSCHGLATAIERDPHSAAAFALIEECTGRASGSIAAGEPCYVGLCCTHYALAADEICRAVSSKVGRPVVPLDPNTRMVHDTLARRPAGAAPGEVTVEVVSKVTLEQSSRDGVAGLLAEVSPVTAAALRGYRHVPDLF